MSSGIVLTLIIGLLAVGKSIILPTILSRYPLMARAAPDKYDLHESEVCKVYIERVSEFMQREVYMIIVLVVLVTIQVIYMNRFYIFILLDKIGRIIARRSYTVNEQQENQD